MNLVADNGMLNLAGVLLFAEKPEWVKPQFVIKAIRYPGSDITSSLESNFSRKGQNAYHPRLIVSILTYAYSQGIFSSRQIEKRCNEDLSFMYIAGMNCPNFRVLSDFRKDNADFFNDCFKLFRWHSNIGQTTAL